MQNPIFSLFCGLAGLAYILPTGSAATVTTPYFQDFESYASDGPTDFFEPNTAAYQIVTQGPGDQAYRARITINSGPSATVQVAGSGGNDFSVSTELNWVEFAEGTGASSINFSILAAGSAADQSSFNANNYRLAMDFLNETVGLSKSGSGLAPSSTSGTIPTFSQASTYTLSLTGTYTGATTLDLVASVSDGTDTYTIFHTDNAALSGEHFGYRIAKNGTDTVLGVVLDDFDLDVIPEPSATGLVALSLLCLVARRRRLENGKC